MPPGSGRKGHTPGFLFVAHSMPDRGIIFIDGNNWYHALSNAGVPDLGGLDYAAISRKLLGPSSLSDFRRKSLVFNDSPFQLETVNTVI